MGAASFSCPLPEQPYDITWTFYGIKDWFFQYMDPTRQSPHVRQAFRARARARARIAAIQETTSMEVEGDSPQSPMDEEDIADLEKGYSPDMKALPTRSTGRYDSTRERDPAALAQMLPAEPTAADHDAVAFQAWRDAAIRTTADLLRTTSDEDETPADLLDAHDAPTK